MTVAIRRVGSNIRFSCFIGPMRKTVLRGKRTQAIQTRPAPGTARRLPIASPRSPTGITAMMAAEIGEVLATCQLLCLRAFSLNPPTTYGADDRNRHGSSADQETEAPKGLLPVQGSPAPPALVHGGLTPEPPAQRTPLSQRCYVASLTIYPRRGT